MAPPQNGAQPRGTLSPQHSWATGPWKIAHSWYPHGSAVIQLVVKLPIQLQQGECIFVNSQYIYIYIFVYMYCIRTHCLCYTPRTTIHWDTPELQVLLLAWLVFLLCMAREVPWNRTEHDDFTGKMLILLGKRMLLLRKMGSDQKKLGCKWASVLIGKVMIVLFNSFRSMCTDIYIYIYV